MKNNEAPNPFKTYAWERRHDIADLTPRDGVPSSLIEVAQVAVGLHPEEDASEAVAQQLHREWLAFNSDREATATERAERLARSIEENMGKPHENDPLYGVDTSRGDEVICVGDEWFVSVGVDLLPFGGPTFVNSSSRSLPDGWAAVNSGRTWMTFVRDDRTFVIWLDDNGPDVTLSWEEASDNRDALGLLSSGDFDAPATSGSHDKALKTLVKMADAVDAVVGYDDGPHIEVSAVDFALIAARWGAR